MIYRPSGGQDGRLLAYDRRSKAFLNFRQGVGRLAVDTFHGQRDRSSLQFDCLGSSRPAQRGMSMDRPRQLFQDYIPGRDGSAHAC